MSSPIPSKDNEYLTKSGYSVNEILLALEHALLNKRNELAYFCVTQLHASEMDTLLWSTIWDFCFKHISIANINSIFFLFIMPTSQKSKLPPLQILLRVIKYMVQCEKTNIINQSIEKVVCFESEKLKQYYEIQSNDVVELPSKITESIRWTKDLHYETKQSKTLHIQTALVMLYKSMTDYHKDTSNIQLHQQCIFLCCAINTAIQEERITLKQNASANRWLDDMLKNVEPGLSSTFDLEFSKQQQNLQEQPFYHMFGSFYAWFQQLEMTEEKRRETNTSFCMCLLFIIEIWYRFRYRSIYSLLFPMLMLLHFHSINWNKEKAKVDPSDFGEALKHYNEIKDPFPSLDDLIQSRKFDTHTEFGIKDNQNGFDIWFNAMKERYPNESSREISKEEKQKSHGPASIKLASLSVVDESIKGVKLNFESITATAYKKKKYKSSMIEVYNKCTEVLCNRSNSKNLTLDSDLGAKLNIKSIPPLKPIMEVVKENTALAVDIYGSSVSTTTTTSNINPPAIATATTAEKQTESKTKAKRNRNKSKETDGVDQPKPKRSKKSSTNQEPQPQEQTLITTTVTPLIQYNNNVPVVTAGLTVANTTNTTNNTTVFANTTTSQSNSPMVKQEHSTVVQPSSSFPVITGPLKIKNIVPQVKGYGLELCYGGFEFSFKIDFELYRQRAQVARSLSIPVQYPVTIPSGKNKNFYAVSYDYPACSAALDVNGQVDMHWLGFLNLIEVPNPLFVSFAHKDRMISYLISLGQVVDTLELNYWIKPSDGFMVYIVSKPSNNNKEEKQKIQEMIKEHRDFIENDVFNHLHSVVSEQRLLDVQEFFNKIIA